MSINTNSNSTETSIDNEIDIDSTVWKTVTRNRRCSNSKCDIAYEDNIFVPAGEWVIDTTPEPWELQTCPKCGSKFAVKFTTSDTKFYPSNPNPPPPERKQGKYRNIVLESRPYPDSNGNGCRCEPCKKEFEFKAIEPGENGKDWEPTSHDQTCQVCGKEYYLDWTITERNYF